MFLDILSRLSSMDKVYLHSQLVIHQNVKMYKISNRFLTDQQIDIINQHDEELSKKYNKNI